MWKHGKASGEKAYMELLLLACTLIYPLNVLQFSGFVDFLAM